MVRARHEFAATAQCATFQDRIRVIDQPLDKWTNDQARDGQPLLGATQASRSRARLHGLHVHPQGLQ